VILGTTRTLMLVTPRTRSPAPPHVRRSGLEPVFPGDDRTRQPLPPADREQLLDVFRRDADQEQHPAVTTSAVPLDPIETRPQRHQIVSHISRVTTFPARRPGWVQGFLNKG
jgi:hypothetical protein